MPERSAVSTWLHGSGGMMAPLREPVFRRIWISSIFSNLGQQMQAVAAAWAMLQISRQADLVAMVQTASMLPVMLLAVIAGALADMYDRRRVAIAALVLRLAGASLLAAIVATGHITPTWILLCCFITGTGFALYLPAWQASAVEIVGVKSMPAAVSLYSISSNTARSIGPALAGIVIAASGMVLVFVLNTIFYIPIIIALLLWRRETVPPRLPPERLDRAMIAGLRFIQNSPVIRRVMVRSLITGMGGAAFYSMLPLVAHDKLNGGPGSYGVLLGAFGGGAVAIALAMARIRLKFLPEVTVLICTIVRSAALLIAAFSPSLLLTAVAMLGAGGAFMLETASYNVSVQTSSPRWVSGRALAMFQTMVAGGLAGGAVLWGRIAASQGIVIALVSASAFVLAGLLLARILPMGEGVSVQSAPPIGSDPVVGMALTGRSGPVAIEVEYRVRSEDARIFYHAMREFRRARERNGAFNTTLARDIADPELWVERYDFPTWNDYLRARDRTTVDDHQVRERVYGFHIGDAAPRVRRMLVRPTGSVRWREEVIDPGQSVSLPIS